MPACVTDSWKGIVFGVESDNSASRSIFGFEGCGYTMCVWCDSEAQLLKVFDDIFVCLEFLETEFRVVMNLMKWSVH